MPPREAPDSIPSQDNDKNKSIENTPLSRNQSNANLSVNVSANNSHTSLASLHSVKSIVSLDEIQDNIPILEKEITTSSKDDNEDNENFFLFWN